MPAPTQANSTSQWAKVSVGSSARRRVGGQKSDQALQIDFCPHNAVFMVPALPAGLGER